MSEWRTNKRTHKKFKMPKSLDAATGAAVGDVIFFGGIPGYAPLLEETPPEGLPSASDYASLKRFEEFVQHPVEELEAALREAGYHESSRVQTPNGFAFNHTWYTPDREWIISFSSSSWANKPLFVTIPPYYGWKKFEATGK